MSTVVTFNGQSHTVPAQAETGWADDVSNLLIALCQGALSKAGGSFTLSAEVDFGGSFGFKTKYLKSRGTNVASAGEVRLANTETIGWRNAANNGDLSLTVSAANALTFGGNPVLALALGVADTALRMNAAGTAYEWSKIVDANIDAAAAVAYSKLALTGAIVNADISDSADIASSKIAETLSAKILASSSATTAFTMANQAELRLAEASGTGTNYVGFKAPSSITANKVWTLPSADGSSSQVLSTNGSGVLAWATVATDSLTESHVKVGDATDTAAAVDTSSVGDILASSTDGLTIKDGSVDADKLDVGVTQTEFDYLAGVTSDIQTQLDAKQPLDSDLTAIAAVASAGLIARTGAGTAAARTVTAGSNKLAVTNGDGVSGNPTVDVTEANLSLANIGGSLNVGTQTTGTLAIANGGTGQTGQTAAFDALAPTTTKGDLIASNGTDNIRFAVGANGTVLTSDSAEASGLKWSSPLTNPMDSQGDLIVGGASGAATKLDAGTSGQILMAKGAASPEWVNTLTTGKTIDGSADEVQLTVQGHSTQTSDILLVEKSDGTDLLQVTNTAGTKIRGTTTNDNAAAGFVGEYLEGVTTSFTTFSGSTVYSDIGSITLTPGDWDVTYFMYVAAFGATVTAIEGGFGTVSGNNSSGLSANRQVTAPGPAAANTTIQIANYRMSVSSNTTVYGKAWATYSGGTPQFTGRISARRVR